MGQCHSSATADHAMVDSSLKFTLDLLDETSVRKKKVSQSPQTCRCSVEKDRECLSMACTEATLASSRSQDLDKDDVPVSSVVMVRHKATGTGSSSRSHSQRRKPTKSADQECLCSQQQSMDSSAITESTRRSTRSSSTNRSKLHSRRKLLKAREIAYQASHPDWDQDRLQSSNGVLVHAHWKITPPQGAARSA